MCFFESLLIVHLWLQATILSSWVILGPIAKKPGMCVLTELQKKINQYNNVDFPDSYMIYLYSKFGINVVNTKRMDKITFSVFAMCTTISVVRIYIQY